MKAKGVFVTAVLTAVLCISSTVLAATYDGGSGTVESPYEIRTPEQMNTIGANPGDWASCFKLMADIDMVAYTGTQYNIIGNSTTPFTGTFDGDNHKIRNLTYSTTTVVNFVGLFGYTHSATIKNLGVDNVHLYTGGSSVGGLVGYQNYGAITNCTSTGSVSSSSTAGGLVGGSSGAITSCTSTGSVTSSSSSESDCSSAAAGGLVGGSSGAITSCTSTGSVTSSSSSSSSYISIVESYAGGLVGVSSGAITSCTSTGSVSSSSSSVTSTSTSIYSSAGGLVGQSSGGSSISMCYSTGPVFAIGRQVYKGGLVGHGGASMTACFWDNQTSGQTTSAGGSGAQGKTTVEMRSLSTFTDAGWDFTDTDGDAADWKMPALGYPYLAWKGCQAYPAGDSNQDCKVDMTDLMILSIHWLEGV